jgi:hypothetical protein
MNPPTAIKSSFGAFIGSNATSGITTTVVTPAVHINIRDKAICPGDRIVFRYRVPATNYLWSTGETTDSLVVTTDGQYIVTLTTATGCVNRDTVDVTLYPSPIPLLGADKLVCIGASTVLKPSVYGTSIAWNTGAATDSIIVSTPGLYSVTISSPNGCLRSDTVEVKNIAPITQFLGLDKTICASDPVVLKPNLRAASVSWSNGQTGDSISVTAPGQYIATLTTLAGCINRDTIEVINFAELHGSFFRSGNHQVDQIIGINNDTISAFHFACW